MEVKKVSSIKRYLYTVERAVVEHMEGEEEREQRDGEERRGKFGPRHPHYQHTVRQLALRRPERRPRQPSDTMPT